MLAYQITRHILGEEGETDESEIFFTENIKNAFNTIETFLNTDRLFERNTKYEIRHTNII